MPAVFVHGVPDTYHVWEPVFEHLRRKDSIALSLPGFASPVPKAFDATKEDYVRWLTAKLESFGEPVDLVGHDWGCLLSLRAASLRPDLIRSWAAGGGPIHANYEWHALARIWQTPGAGEQWMSQLDLAQLSATLEQLGVPAELARQASTRVDLAMKDCILRLYRSAVTVGAEWQADLQRITAPGLVLWGKQDSACPARFADCLAADAGAQGTAKFDTAHWFQLEAPQETAEALEHHWSASTVR